jgi:hypothetical protein
VIGRPVEITTDGTTIKVSLRAPLTSTTLWKVNKLHHIPQVTEDVINILHIDENYVISNEAHRAILKDLDRCTAMRREEFICDLSGIPLRSALDTSSCAAEIYNYNKLGQNCIMNSARLKITETIILQEDQNAFIAIPKKDEYLRGSYRCGDEEGAINITTASRVTVRENCEVKFPRFFNMYTLEIKEMNEDVKIEWHLNMAEYTAKFNSIRIKELGTREIIKLGEIKEKLTRLPELKMQDPSKLSLDGLTKMKVGTSIALISTLIAFAALICYKFWCCCCYKKYISIYTPGQ